MLDELPVYELKRGAYVVVNPETERVMTTWVWFGNLGRNYDTFMKGGENPDDDKCVEVIEKNKDKILRSLEGFDEIAESDDGQEFLDEQEKFYDSLEEGKTYDYFSGEYLEG